MLNTGSGAGADAHKTEDRAAWRRELSDILGDDDKAVQLDVVEDLLRKVVRQSNLFIAVEKRFGFVEPVWGRRQPCRPGSHQAADWLPQPAFRGGRQRRLPSGAPGAHEGASEAAVSFGCKARQVPFAEVRLPPKKPGRGHGGKTGGGTATILKSDSACQGAAPIVLSWKGHQRRGASTLLRAHLSHAH